MNVTLIFPSGKKQDYPLSRQQLSICNNDTTLLVNVCSHVNQRIRQLYENLNAQKDNILTPKVLIHRTMDFKEYQVLTKKKDSNLSSIAAKLNDQLKAAGETTQNQAQTKQQPTQTQLILLNYPRQSKFLSQLINENRSNDCSA